MKTVFKPLLAATVLSLSMASVAMAKSSHEHKTHHCKQKEAHVYHHKDMLLPHRPSFLKGIDLTETQKDQLFELRHSEIPKMRAQIKERHQLKKELMQLSENYSEANAKTIADKLASIERDAVLARAHHHQQLFSILTPTQRKQAAENIENIKKHDEAKTAYENAS